MIAASPFFETANRIEAAVRFILAAGLLTVGIQRSRRRRLVLLAAITLIAFGFSDLVETKTGAWWRPWWLLVWKVACVLALAAITCIAVRRRLQ